MRETILLFLLLISAVGFSQGHVTGKISNNSGESLPGASIIFKNNEGNIVTYTLSTDNGTYTINIDNGAYIIEVNFLGFQKISQKMIVTDGKSFTQNFTLKESEEQLKELVIEAEQPVRLHGDTLVYDAKKLAKGHEVVVEDLLKNIPGITVQKDGKIFFGETEVQKVMVDGDDLFNRGYSLLTKNMPSKPLDKVEVLQNYSRNKLLKGIENSDGVAINLTVDEKYKNIWFGDVSVAFGNRERYDVGGNLMNFSKAYKNFLTTNFNNAGVDKVGSINDMIYNATDMESTGGDSNAASVISMGSGGTRFGADRSRFNNAKMATVSTIIPLSEKIKLTLKGFAGYDELSAWSNYYSVTDIPGTYFENNQSNSSKNKINKGYLNAYFNFDISKVSMLETATTFNKGKTGFRNGLVFNGTATMEELESQNTFFEQKATFTHKWNDRNAVLVKGRFSTDRLPQQYSMGEYLMGDLFAYDNIFAIGNDVQSKKQYAGLQADFKLRQKNNDLIEFTLGYNDNRDDLSTRFSLFTDAGAVQPAGFQSQSAYKVGDLYARSGYTWKINRFTINGDATIHQLFNRFSGTDGSTKKQNPFYVNPTVSLSYEFNPQNMFTARYYYSVRNSNLLEVNDAFLLISSRSFAKGLGYFNQMENSLASIGYSTKHYLNRYSFSWNIDYSKQNDAIRNRTQLNQNSSLSESFVMKGGDRFNASFSSYFVIKKLKGSVKANVRANKSVYYNMVNDLGLRKISYYNQTYTLGWYSDFKKAFDFGIGTEWIYNQNKSELTFKNSTKVSFLDLMYKYGNNFTAKLTNEYYNFGGVDRFSDYIFSDLESSYAFKDKKYIVSLTAHNLFNTDAFTTYSISDTGYYTGSYRLLPRYVMLSLKFRF